MTKMASGEPRLPPVSVIIPTRNDEAVIATALASVLSQDYAGPMEVIIADGSGTSAMLEVLQSHHATVRLVPNPGKIVSTGFNAALQTATGQVIVRCDAHSTLPPTYLRRAVEVLERTGAANVGGRQRPVGTTFFERAVAIAMTTVLGAGDARYRIGGDEGPVDTVYLGAFRREALEAVGGFDPTLVRNQDYELNWRLREHGETVWFDPALAATYWPRGTLWALARQYFNYGRWKRVVLRQHPRSLQPRHLAAPLLVSTLAVSALLVPAGVPWTIAAAPSLAYFLALTAGSLAVGLFRRAPAALLAPVILAAMHLAWGTGFFLPPRVGAAGSPAVMIEVPQEKKIAA